jgi:hypothetical protein
MQTGKLTILFSGMIASDPHQGGATWAVLQYLLGFRKLGHDVYFVEPVAGKSLRPSGTPLADSTNAKYFEQVVREFDFADHSALLLEGTTETVGLDYSAITKAAGRADILLNVSGMLTDARLISNIPKRVYLDLDPAFIQLWSDEYGIDMRFEAHNRFVTIGQSIGEPECDIPTCGYDWIKTLQPIVLSEWPVADEIERDVFTTVGNWRAYGSAERDGVFYGQKAHSLRTIIDLPKRTSEEFALAMTIHPGDEKDLSALKENGWTLLDPTTLADSPDSYRRFVQGSRGELGVAKSGYVKSNCGWFSDRSICYLASGRPVLAQETGFSRHLPTGEGLFGCSNAEELAQGAEAVRRDYQRHSKAGRALAEEFFDSNKVLPRLIEEVAAT